MNQAMRCAALAAWFFLAGCGAAAGAGPSAPTTLAGLQVPDLAHAQSIAIDDVWNGFNRAAPIEAHYKLQRGADGFRGEADFSAGRGYPGGPKHVPADIAIPQPAIDKFFAALAQAPLHAGPYTPKRGHTDDYPDMTITLSVDGRDVVFSSQSQGKERNPWHVTIAGREYVSESGQPAAALDRLAPYLKRSVLNKLLEELNR